jgi:hypothetical protein
VRFLPDEACLSDLSDQSFSLACLALISSVAPRSSPPLFLQWTKIRFVGEATETAPCPMINLPAVGVASRSSAS